MSEFYSTRIGAITGISTHIITFEVGAVPEGSEWQAPSVCFTNPNLSRNGASGAGLELEAIKIGVGVDRSLDLRI